MIEKTIKEEEILTRSVVRFSSVMLGVVLGIFAGAGLFLATIWLVLKGGPNPGPHLALLGQYFPGYDVTFPGAFLGFLYAFAVGFITGYLLGGIYNKVARES